MNRRALLLNLANLNRRDKSDDDTPRVLAGGIEPYATPLTRADVYHLLRRMGFAASKGQADAFVGKMASDVVEQLLGDDTQPPSPGSWINEITENPAGSDQQTRAAIEKAWENNYQALGKWWVAQMVADNTSKEKLTLFWSSHWTSEFMFDGDVSIPQTLYRQLATLRQLRLADMRELALEMTVDNAMLNYLGGSSNEAGKPNENYARELLELFTTGIGWYTEGDVKEAARVLTGWKVARWSDEAAPNENYNSWFSATAHDTGQKRFMGQDIAARTVDNNTAYQVKMEEVYALIKIIYRERPEAASKFLAEKLYRYYMYSSRGDVDTAFVGELAAKFRDDDFSIRSIVKILFTSAAFYDPAIRGAQIKTPFEFLVGLQRQLGVGYASSVNALEDMDQAAMDPPNVSGWPGYRAWISTNTYPVRRRIATDLIKGMSESQAQSFITQFANHTDVRAFVKATVEYMLPLPVTKAREDNYVQALMQNAPEYEWPNIVSDTATAAVRLRNLLTVMAKAPDFNLC